jgi:hypothetical protein
MPEFHLAGIPVLGSGESSSTSQSEVSTPLLNFTEVKSGFYFEIFHEQLPLPVPCYDLLPVIELTLGPLM